MVSNGVADLTHSGAFLLGAALATIATLRIVRYVTDFFSGVKPSDRGRSVPVRAPSNRGIRGPSPSDEPDDEA